MMATDDQPVLILGAGINGAAIARELVLNQVPVVLVDKHDLASGATAYSSRLIHGGLRYLEYRDFDLVRESLEERERLLSLAPDFVQPLRLFIPVEGRISGAGQAAMKFLWRGSFERMKPVARGGWIVGAGLWLYDRLARSEQLPPHQSHSISDPDVPQVDCSRYRSLYSYWDAQIAYPERYVLALLSDARQAAQHQGTRLEVKTYCQAQWQGGKVSLSTSARPIPGPGQDLQVVSPSAIVNATGAWVDATLCTIKPKPERLTGKPKPERLIGGTKGSHLLTSHAGLQQQMRGNAVYAEAADGRPVFVLPFGGQTLIGTTDLPFDADPQQAVALDAEIDYLIGAVNRIFSGCQLARDDIDMHYSGVRPLPYVGDANPAGITRRHLIHHDTIGEIPLLSIVGGKLTTSRSLAEEVTGELLPRLGRKVTTNSRETPLARPSYAADQAGLPVGSEQVDSVIQHEYVTCLEDLVERRLMLLYDPSLSRAVLARLARRMSAAGLLPEDQVDQAVQECQDRLRRHYGKRVLDAP